GDRARIRIWAHPPDPAGRVAMRLAVDTADDHVQLTSHSLEYTDRDHDDSPTTAHAPTAHPDQWCPVRPLQPTGASGGSPIVLDDLDPFREPGALEPARRLTAAEFRHWRAVFDEAWHLLVRDHPHRVDGVAGLLRSLVPLAAPAGVTSISASSLEAFGSVLLSTPTDSAQLAVTLIHEIQHSKLAAIDDLSPLVARRSPAVHYAPWRLDPRPVEGLLHGAFAFVAVAGYWYERSLIDEGGQALLAAYQFVWCRESVRGVVVTLEANETLTPAGRRLTAGIADQLRRWSGAAVPELAHRLGMLEVGDCRVRWRLRNLTPEPEVISSWARAWLRGDPYPPSGPPVCSVRAGTPSAAGGNRVDVARRLLAGETVDASGRARADVLLLTGRAEEAAAEYRRAVRADGNALAAWSGLMLSRLGTGGRSARGYSTRPETVRALWLAIRRASGDTPDLDALAAWIADVDDADTRRSRSPAVERPGRAGRAVVNPRTA
ncbi:HEXXH motif-containing putative peptide modification protein, partial [Parafrankia sp. EUN1f]|uniref:aKG-HExxH-type peptide beta-hydroxylase n=1 Tax=Parafrankia sp. EUN1f TaxID=102897 RepID=UPI001E500E41